MLFLYSIYIYIYKVYIIICKYMYYLFTIVTCIARIETKCVLSKGEYTVYSICIIYYYLLFPASVSMYTYIEYYS